MSTLRDIGRCLLSISLVLLGVWLSTTFYGAVLIGAPMAVIGFAIGLSDSPEEE